MRTSGQTEMTKLEVAFRNFAKAYKKKKGNPCLIIEELEDVYQGFIYRPEKSLKKTCVADEHILLKAINN
jgi:hypothetical protein